MSRFLSLLAVCIIFSTAVIATEGNSNHDPKELEDSKKREERAQEVLAIMKVMGQKFDEKISNLVRNRYSSYEELDFSEEAIDLVAFSATMTINTQVMVKLFQCENGVNLEQLATTEYESYVSNPVKLYEATEADDQTMQKRIETKRFFIKKERDSNYYASYSPNLAGDDPEEVEKMFGNLCKQRKYVAQHRDILWKYIQSIPKKKLQLNFVEYVCHSKKRLRRFISSHRHFMEVLGDESEASLLFSQWVAHVFEGVDLSEESIKYLYSLSKEDRGSLSYSVFKTLNQESDFGSLTLEELKVLRLTFTPPYTLNQEYLKFKTPFGILRNYKGDKSCLLEHLYKAFSTTREIPDIFIRVMNKVSDVEKIKLCEAAAIILQADKGGEKKFSDGLFLLNKFFSAENLEKFCLSAPILRVSKEYDVRHNLHSCFRENTETLRDISQLIPKNLNSEFYSATLINLFENYKKTRNPNEVFDTEEVILDFINIVQSRSNLRLGNALTLGTSKDIKHRIKAASTICEYKKQKMNIGISVESELERLASADYHEADRILEIIPVLAKYYFLFGGNRYRSFPPSFVDFLLENLSQKEKILKLFPIIKNLKDAGLEQYWHSNDIEGHLRVLIRLPENHINSAQSQEALLQLSEVISSLSSSEASKYTRRKFKNPGDFEYILNRILSNPEKYKKVRPEGWGEKGEGFGPNSVCTHISQIRENFDPSEVDAIFDMVGFGFFPSINRTVNLFLTELCRTLNSCSSTSHRKAVLECLFEYYPKSKHLNKDNKEQYFDFEAFISILSNVSPERLLKVSKTAFDIFEMVDSTKSNFYIYFPRVIFPLLDTLMENEVKIIPEEIATIMKYVDCHGVFHDPHIFQRLYKKLAEKVDLVELHKSLLPILKIDPREYSNLIIKCEWLLSSDNASLQDINKAVSGLISLAKKMEDLNDDPNFFKQVINRVGLIPAEDLERISANIGVAQKASVFLTEIFAKKTEFKDYYKKTDLQTDMFLELLSRCSEKQILNIMDVAPTIIPVFIAEDVGQYHLFQLMGFLGQLRKGPHLEKCLKESEKIIHSIEGVQRKVAFFRTLQALPEEAFKSALLVFSKQDVINQINKMEPYVEGGMYMPLLTLFFEHSEWDFNKLQKLWLKESLCSPEEDVADAARLFIVNNLDEFGLTEFDELYFETINAGIRLRNKEDTDSPYFVYENLKEMRKRPVKWKKTPTETLDGIKIQLDPSYFERKIPQQVIRIGDLGQLDHHGFLNGKIKEFTKRAKDEADKTEKPFDTCVQKYTGTPWSIFSTAVLGGTYLSDLVDFQDWDIKRPLALHSARFCKVLEYCSTKSTDCEQDDVLCEVDVHLLKWFYTIASCKGGKREGINLVYSELPVQFKLFGSSSEKEASPCIEIINNELLGQVEDMVKGGTNGFYKALCGLKPNETVEQGPHQAIYLRNLIPFLGPLVFDAHTKMIYVKLMERSRSDVMNELFKRLLPSRVVSTLTNHLNELLLDPKSGTFTSISDYMGKYVEEHWSIDTVTGTTRITEKGTIDLLTQIGVINIVTTPVSTHNSNVLEDD